MRINGINKEETELINTMSWDDIYQWCIARGTMKRFSDEFISAENKNVHKVIYEDGTEYIFLWVSVPEVHRKYTAISINGDVVYETMGNTIY